jgi:ABC-type transport system substrate-binding protein
LLQGKLLGLQLLRDRLLKSEAKDRKSVLLDEDPLDGVTVLDSYSAKFQFLEPFPEFEQLLTRLEFSIIPRELILEESDETASPQSAALGTGPFRLKYWNRSKELLLNRNLTYRDSFYPSNGKTEFRILGLFEDANKPLPLLDEISFLIYADEKTLIESFLKRKIDLFYPSPAKNKDIFQPNQEPISELAKEYVIDVSKPFRSLVQFQNLEHSYWNQKPGLKSVLFELIPKDQLRDEFFRGIGVFPQQEARKTIDYYRALLKKSASQDEPQKEPLEILISDANIFSRTMGEWVQKTLESQGLKVQLKYLPFLEFRSQVVRGDFIFAIGSRELDEATATKLTEKSFEKKVIMDVLVDYGDLRLAQKSVKNLRSGTFAPTFMKYLKQSQ